MRNLKVVFPEGSAFANYRFTIDEDEDEEQEEITSEKAIKKHSSEKSN